MTYSNATMTYTNLLGYGLMAVGIMTIWFATKKEHEAYLVFKVIGYTFLAMFRFSINQIHLPAGAVIAYFLMQRTSQNKAIKRRAVFWGFLLFIISFIPIQNVIDHALYPRDDIK